MLRKYKGFTLVELMMTLGTIGILATIAYPSYTEQVMKSRRADAKAGLLSLQMAQEKYRANCSQYADAIDGDAVNYSCTPGDYTLTHNASSPDGYYDLNILAGSSATAYTLSATPSSGGKQEGDKCGTFQIDQSSAKSVVNAAVDYDASMCWNF